MKPENKDLVFDLIATSQTVQVFKAYISQDKSTRNIELNGVTFAQGSDRITCLVEKFFKAIDELCEKEINEIDELLKDL